MKRHFVSLVFLIVLLVAQLAVLVPLVYAPTVAFSTVKITSVHTCPLDNRTFVVAYHDEDNDVFGFQIYDTNGTQILAETVVDATSGSLDTIVKTSIGVSAFNSTHFVVGWYDRGSYYVRFAVYNTTGALLSGPTSVDTDVGASACSVQVSCFNSTYFVIAWFDRTDTDATFAIYDSSSNKIAGPVDADTDVGNYGYSVSVSTFNSTLFVMGWYDYTDSDATFAIYNSTGTQIGTTIDADTSVSTGASVSVSALNSTHFVIGWYDLADQDATFAVYDSSGNVKTAATDVDDTAGTSCASVQVSALNSTVFVISWYDSVDFDLSFATYRSDGTVFCALTDIESWATAFQQPFRFQSPCSQETGTGIEIYNDNWIIAYGNTTTEAIWKAFTPAGATWDGTTIDITPPTYSSASTNTTAAGQLCLFYTKWTDETDLATTGGFIFGTNNTGTWSNETWTAFTANPDWSNKTKTLNSTVNLKISWQIWANDTNNNWNSTGEMSFTTTAIHTPSLCEYYNTGDDNSESVYGVFWRAQTFTVGASNHTVTSVKLKLFRYNSPGTVTVSIRATVSGHPSGSDLTSGTVNGNTLNATSPGEWYEINVTEYSLSANIKYAIVVRAPSGNATNILYWRYDVTSPTYDYGNLEESDDSGGTWTSYTDYDCMFEVWGVVEQTYWWETTPYVFETDLGLNLGESVDNIFYNATDMGGKAAVYVAYQNSSFETWEYQVRVFDTNSRVWTAPQNISACSENDGHWSPAISVLPDGRLIILYGYYSSIYYRISTYNASTETNLTKLISDWGDIQEFTAPTAPYCYPHPLRWNNDFIVTLRLGTSTSGNWTYMRWNVTSQAFNALITLLTFKPLTLYAGFSVSGNNILCSFNRYNATSEADENLYFIYSPDKGYTWKNITGSTLSLPIVGDNALIMASPFRTRSDDMTPPFIDENGKVVVACWRLATIYPQTVLGDLWMKICQYSGGLGEAGTWDFDNVTDLNGTQIWGRGAIYMNLYYGRPCIFTSDSYGNKKVSAYIRYPSETHMFKLVWEDDEEYVTGSPLYIVSGYRYEVFCLEMSYNLLGFPENGVTAANTATNTIYAVKFTAQQTCELVGIQMYAYSVHDLYWAGALYNSTLQLIADAGNNTYTTGTDSLGWLQTVGFVDYPTITLGEVYYIAFKVNLDGAQYYYNVSETINQTFTCSTTWGEAFPATLSPVTYYNRTISIVAFSMSIRIRGVGDILPTKLYVGWNEFSAWTEDVGKTLEQICANIQFGSIGSTVVIKVNGTEYRYDYGYEPNTTIQILATSDEEQIYCTTGGDWFHDYTNFYYRKDSPSQSFTVTLNGQRILEGVRGASQTILASLSGLRLIDVLRSASEAVTFALQGIGVKITVYLVDAILTIATSFQASRLAEWLKTVTQAIAVIFESVRLGGWFRSVNQSITTSLTTNRLIDITRTTGLLLGISVVTSKLAQFVRSTSQTFNVGFGTTGIGDFFRVVTQSVTATLNAQRLGELFRSASQSVAFSLQTTGERIALYLRDATLTIATSLQVSRLADLFKTVSQSITILLQSARLAELWKSASQTITLSLVGNRLIDVTRTVSQALTLSIVNSRFAEFTRATSQTFNVGFATTRIGEFFRSVSQSLTATLNMQRLIEVTRLASQTLTFSFQTIGERVGIYIRNVALTIATSLQGSRLAEWIKSVSQTFTVDFAVASLADFARSVSQTIATVLNGERMVDLLRSASQTITFTLQTIGERVGIYLRNVALTITTAFQGSRLAEWIKATSQTISVTLGNTRLAQFVRSASQSIVLSLEGVGEKIGIYLRNVLLTITATLNTNRLTEATRQATQTLNLSLSTSRVAEFLAIVVLTITTAFNATRLVDLLRQASQSLNFLLNGERLIEVSRSVSQTITLTLEGFGEMVGNYFRTALLDVGFTFASLAEVPAATILLALAIALIVVACVVTFAVATTTKKEPEKD